MDNVWTMCGKCCVDSVMEYDNQKQRALQQQQQPFSQNLGELVVKSVSVGKFSQKFGRIVNLGELTERCVSVGKFSQIFGRIFTISPKYLGESSLFLPKIWENLHHFSQISGRIQCSSAVAAAAGMLL